MEYGLKLWDILWEAGQPLGAVAAGYSAIKSLRLEKGVSLLEHRYPLGVHPLRGRSGFAVKLKKGDFLGYAALERARSEDPRRKLCCLTLNNPRAGALGGEPLLAGEHVLGRVTSGGYGTFRTPGRAGLAVGVLAALPFLVSQAIGVISRRSVIFLLRVPLIVLLVIGAIYWASNVATSSPMVRLASIQRQVMAPASKIERPFFCTWD